MRRSLKSAGLVALVAVFSAASARGDDKGWETVKAGEARIAVPKGWRSLDGVRRMVIYRQGDGVQVPAVDDSGAPLQIGLSVEKFPETKESLQEMAEGLAAIAKKNPRLTIVGKETIEDVKLADGNAAKLLTTEFIKEGNRRSLQRKLIVKDGDTAWIVTGFLVGGKEGKWPKADSKYAKWLTAHMTSFCLDPEKFRSEEVVAAYKELDN